MLLCSLIGIFGCVAYTGDLGRGAAGANERSHTRDNLLFTEDVFVKIVSELVCIVRQRWCWCCDRNRNR